MCTISQRLLLDTLLHPAICMHPLIDGPHIAVLAEAAPLILQLQVQVFAWRLCLVELFLPEPPFSRWFVELLEALLGKTGMGGCQT